ncbi:hypothetical protein MAPG_03906 [Magnaporthiopsis poae ATCC 64411]|uniref:Uncharacterized protein n=1 Tax=Magnaporthiopsis poae (strain ATCC 64411 / 73-15) TaxID=644358 RepID=A0A0C4DVA4_MAGP6|nr:hypothetical protein MAPG_03906 [Magnaporthiopsis poae ATCC 64411]
MAEVFGIVAGAAGIVPLVTQVVAGVKTLRRIRDSATGAAAQFDELIGDLEFLHHVLQMVERAESYAGGGVGHPVVLNQCRRDCAKVLIGLEALQRRFPVDEAQSDAPASKLSVLKAKGIVRFWDWEEEVQSLRQSVKKAKQDLQLNLSLLSIVQTQSVFDGIKSIAGSIQRLEIAGPSTEPVTGSSGATTAAHGAAISPTVAETTQNQLQLVRPSPRRRQHDCAVRACSCRCHLVGRVRRQFWSFSYTPLSIILQGCDKANCSARRYSISFTLGLTQLGLPLATILQLQFLDGGGKFSLRPSLEIQRIVRNTSRGFELLQFMEHGYFTLDEVVKGFQELYRSNPGDFRRHVTATGMTYVKWVAQNPYLAHAQRETLLRLLMCEFGMEGGTQDISFLQGAMVKWLNINEPPWILVKTLLDNGLAVDELDQPQAKDWPPPFAGLHCCDLGKDPDLGYVKLLTSLANRNPGYGGMTKAHELVQKESTSINELLEAVNSSAGTALTNFLGQTPLHFAASTEHNSTRVYIKALVAAGLDIDSGDIRGITPLMYAAGTNSTDAFVTLLEAGADVTRCDHSHNQTFLDYALHGMSWDVVKATIDNIRRLHGPESSLWYASTATRKLLTTPELTPRDTIFHFLISNIGNVNILIPATENGPQDTTLMHHVQSLAEAKILVSNGFDQFNQTTSEGHTPLMSAVSRYEPDPALVEFLLDCGADPDAVDTRGHTALFHLMRGACQRFRPGPMNEWKCAEILYSRAINPDASDGCSCPCSPSGCTPDSAIDYPSDWYSMSAILDPVELIVAIFEARGGSAARLALLSLIRRQKFVDLNLRHTCCKGLGQSNAKASLGCQPNTAAAMACLDSAMESMIPLSLDELLDEWFRSLAQNLGKSEEEQDDDTRAQWVESVVRSLPLIINHQMDRFDRRAVTHKPRWELSFQLVYYMSRLFANGAARFRNPPSAEVCRKRRLSMVYHLVRQTVGVEYVLRDPLFRIPNSQWNICKEPFLEAGRTHPFHVPESDDPTPGECKGE